MKILGMKWYVYLGLIFLVIMVGILLVDKIMEK